MKNFYYVARFYPEQISFFKRLNLKTNFSVNKKIKGILNSLKCRKNKIGVVCSIIDKPKFKTNEKIFYLNNIKIIIPSYHKSFLRAICYIKNIISTKNSINKIYSKDKNSYFICWDYLPDTLIPLLLSKVPLKSVIMDIEELIQKDPEASTIFKLFEKIFIKFLNFNFYFLASKNLIVNKKANINQVINGFFSENEEEEKILIKKMNKKKKSKKKITIFYSARLDQNRGSDLILEIDNLLLREKKYEFIIFCFGDHKIFKNLEEKIRNKNTKLYYQKNRNFYLRKILNTDISLNLLKNDVFGKNSFPSKIIEYLMFSKTIISTVKIHDVKYDNILVSNYDSQSILKKIKHISKNINFYEKEYFKRRDNFLKTYSIKNYRNILENKFSAIK